MSSDNKDPFPNIDQYTEAQTNWQPHHRGYFQIYFDEWKLYIILIQIQLVFLHGLIYDMPTLV